MPETEQEGDGQERENVPVTDTMEEQFDLLAKRFAILQEEAQRYGINSVVGLCCYDYMDQQSYRSTQRRGDWFAARGLLQTMAEEIGAE